MADWRFSGCLLGRELAILSILARGLAICWTEVGYLSRGLFGRTRFAVCLGLAGWLSKKGLAIWLELAGWLSKKGLAGCQLCESRMAEFLSPTAVCMSNWVADRELAVLICWLSYWLAISWLAGYLSSLIVEWLSVFWGYLVVWLSSGNWLELAGWRGLLDDYLSSRVVWLWIGYLNSWLSLNGWLSVL